MNQENKQITVSERALQKPEVNATQQENVQEIDLVELALMLLDNLRYIILFFLVGAVFFNAYAYFFIHPTYQSTASIYIVSASGGTVVDLTDLNIGSSLKNDYRELLMSYPVLDRVSRKLDLDWSTAQMSSAISVTNPSDTRILKLTATAESPILAMDIANALAEVAVEYLPETMSTEAPNIAQMARLSSSKSGPSYTKYTIMGGFLGALICCAWFVMKSIMDETIRTPEEMEKFFGVPPLTTIPYVGAFEQNTQGHGSGHSRDRGKRSRRSTSKKNSQKSGSGQSRNKGKRSNRSTSKGAA